VEDLEKKYKFSLKVIAYIGNDDNDVSCMKKVGLSFAPADCNIFVLEHANVILSRKGGDGTIRESIDMILKNTNE
jgi:YrbI family 3-deoxy-D-manno-octulosonate 8-phosphate phosphatase